MKVWKHFADEICILPSSSFDQQVDPLDQPLDNDPIVVWNHPSLQHFFWEHFDVAIRISDRQVVLRDHLWPNVFFS
jgi:hypothetical protein